MRPVIFETRTVSVALLIAIGSASAKLSAEAGLDSASWSHIRLASASSIHRIGAVRRMATTL
jgi:hypothetical protein